MLKKGDYYALDNLYGSDSALAVRNSYFLYNGRTDSHPARNSNYRGAGSHHSRTESFVAVAFSAEGPVV